MEREDIMKLICDVLKLNCSQDLRRTVSDSFIHSFIHLFQKYLLSIYGCQGCNGPSDRKNSCSDGA